MMIDDIGGCWNAPAATGGNGYAYLMRYGRHVSAHRYMWTMMRGPIPHGMFVCHKCDNRTCFRPSHLFLGTNRENIADMRRKGRAVDPPIHYGVDHHNAKLTDMAVRSIRNDARTLREVADTHGVSIPTVHRIRRGRGWKHVP